MKYRPITPHLSIYKFEMNMLASILHRITGAALSIAFISFFIIIGLQDLLATNFYFYQLTTLLFGYFDLIVIAFSTTTFYHLLTGLRHFIWDRAILLNVKFVRLSSIGIIISTLVFLIVLSYHLI